MDTASVHDLMFTAIALQDDVLEFWIGASFAVVVAAYLARVDQSTRRLISILYLGACVLFVARFINAAIQIMSYRAFLRAQNLVDFPTSDAFGSVLFTVSLLLMLAGSAAVLYFLNRHATPPPEHNGL